MFSENSSRDNPRIFQTDELIEACRSLEVTEIFLDLSEKDAYMWKWVLIVLHNSFQAFMVCALRGSSGLNTVDLSFNLFAPSSVFLVQVILKALISFPQSHALMPHQAIFQ